ncbi:MAG: dipicolinate synthase subunit B [Bacillota bacterium]
MNKNKLRVGFAITGSYCTLNKAIKMLEALVEAGYDVTPILSEAVATVDTRFYKAADLIADIKKVTGKTPLCKITDTEPIGPKKLLDILIVAPATGNTLAKITYGITDTSVTMAVKAHLRNALPVVIGVSTNDGLGNNAKNIGYLLNSKRIYFIPFGEDDSTNKPTSLIADFNKLIPTIEKAIIGEQLQPLLI